MDKKEFIVTEAPNFSYDNMPSSEDIIKKFEEFRISNKENIFNFIYENQKEIRDIYNKIKNKDCCRIIVPVVDANLVIHKYKEYFVDMVKYLMSVLEKNDNITNKDYPSVFSKMTEKDNTFFDTTASVNEYKISEAMQNIEVLIDFNDFMEETEGLLNKLNSIPCDDVKLSQSILTLANSSATTFISKLLGSIFKSFTEISAALEVGTKITLESSNPRPYKYF